MVFVTKKESELYHYITEYLKLNKAQPSVQNMSDHFKVETSTIYGRLKRLERKGYLEFTGLARSLFLKK